jgi:hypothetical protein
MSPRNRHDYSDYGEEDSSSNFHVGNMDLPPSEDEEDDENSEFEGSVDHEIQHDDDLYNTFHSFSDHEVSRMSRNFAREEEEFEDQESDS